MFLPQIERGLDEEFRDTIRQYRQTAGSIHDGLIDNIQSSVSHVITEEVAFTSISTPPPPSVSLIVVGLHGFRAKLIDKLIDGWQGQCCGLTEPRDWENNIYIQSLNLSTLDVLPCSCFNSAQTVLNLFWCSGATNTTLLHTRVLQHTLSHSPAISEATGFYY